MVKCRMFLCALLAGVVATGCALDTEFGSGGNFDPPDAGTDATQLPLCEPEGPCEVAAMDDAANCVRTPIPGCMPCADEAGNQGTSRNDGACCTTCWAGETCYPTPNAAACGAAGTLCAPCLSGSMRCSADGACAW